jgi:small-conductance mechanosensitive channel
MARILGALLVVVIELSVVLAAALALVSLLRMVMRRAGALRRRTELVALATEVAVRNIVYVGAGLAAVGVLGYNGWLLAGGVDVATHTRLLVSSITFDTWRALALSVGKLTAAAAGILLAVHFLRRGLAWLQMMIRRWDALQDSDEGLSGLFTTLDRALVLTAWLFFAVLACSLLGLPAQITLWTLLVVRITIIVALGLAIVRASTVIVDTLNSLGHRYARGRGWLHYYSRLRPLVPTFRVCLEYVVWIATAALAGAQLQSLVSLALWGPRLIQAIGIFFLGRVAVELGHVEIEHRMLPREGIDDMERRRRTTMVPLLRSTFMYAAYFAAAVLILGTLGFNPLPFLAGAGLLGLVIGFGAQSLINDVVSGFFILFENIYLVGDLIEGGGAKGAVEAIDFRTTRIRDADGRLHIVRNGDMKQVVNYSKDYAIAVVPVDVNYEADLRKVFATLKEAGQRLQAENRDVLEATEIDGITAFGATSLTVRTITRVRPGRHEAVANHMRLAIKEAFDREADGELRTALIPGRRRQPAVTAPERA